MRLRPRLRLARPRLFAAAAAVASLLGCALASAAPLSKTAEFDFFRDVPSRSLEGFAARSDGRLVRGPFVRDLNAELPADLLWTHLALAPDRWLVGSGPDGAILELGLAGDTLTPRVWASLPATHVFALVRLADGQVLAGTSPQGTLALLRDGQLLAQAALPVDSIFDLLPLPDGTVLVATGNPGRLYRLDVATFASVAQVPPATPAAAPDVSVAPATPAATPETPATPATSATPATAEETTSAATPPDAASDATVPEEPLIPTLATTADLTAHGLTLLGEVRDTNLRRLARLPDGRIAAGSAPRGNIYLFPAPPAPGSAATAGAPAAPRLLVENRDAEVVDLVAEADGTLYAALTFATTPVSARLGRSGTPAPGATSGGGPGSPSGAPAGGSGNDETAPGATGSASSAASAGDATRAERFPGRGALLVIPPEGLPETVSLRAGAAFYRLARHGDWFLIAAGEAGDLLGYDPVARRSLTFPGTASAQLNDLAPIPDSPGRFTALRNNPAGLAVIDFTAAGPRRAETRKLDLGTSGRLGTVQFGRFRGTPTPTLALRTSFASDDLEGWTDWTDARAADGGFLAPDLRGRYVRARVTAPAEISADWQLDAGALHHLPDNRRPVLTSYRVLPPGFALRPPAESRAASGTPTTLGQLLGAAGSAGAASDSASSGADAAERAARNAFLASQLVPVRDQLIITWSLQDSDGDPLAATFSLRREGEDTWRDLVVEARLPYAQLDLSTLADGIYFTRLVVREQAPRPEGERLSVTFETDDLVVDRTPPTLQTPRVERLADRLRVSVTATDARSLLAGAGFEFNHGVSEILEQPADGILDGRTETFVLELPLARVVTATAVLITVEDRSGNAASVRMDL